MHRYYRATIELLLKLFSLLGLNPMKEISLFVVSFDILSAAIITILTFMQFTQNEITVKLFADSLESLMTSIHVIIIKFLTLLVKKNQIRSLIVKISSFWDLHQFHPDFRNVCLKQLRQLEFLIKIFVTFCVVTVLVFMSTPLISGRLTIICYVPVSIPRPLFVIFNSLVLGCLSSAVIAFDAFTCVMIIYLYLQFKLLNKKIALIKFEAVATGDDEKRCLGEMRIIVKYHCFLYDFLNNLNSIVSFTLFLHYVIYTINMCFELYLLMKTVGNFVESVRCLLYITALSFEMLICFCIPSTILTEEATKTRNIIYGSQWYQCPFASIKKYIIIMMTQLQKEIALSAGNVFLVNLETCTEAFKKTLSFYTCLRTIENKN